MNIGNSVLDLVSVMRRASKVRYWVAVGVEVRYLFPLEADIVLGYSTVHPWIQVAIVVLVLDEISPDQLDLAHSWRQKIPTALVVEIYFAVDSAQFGHKVSVVEAKIILWVLLLALVPSLSAPNLLHLLPLAVAIVDSLNNGFFLCVVVFVVNVESC